MITENKHYTPDITEFHVGFEYEVNYGEGTGWVKDSLCSKEQVIILPFMRTENIRVKYLDQSDIESLGYKIIKEKFSFDTEDEKWYTFIIDNNEDTLGRKLYLSYHLGYFYNYETGEKIRRLTEISIKWKKENISSLEDINNIYNLFAGEIKNLSELKVLIKQLGIE
jgi:hypothetical protein